MHRLSNLCRSKNYILVRIPKTDYTIPMRRILILWHIIILPFLAVGQSCGLTDTVSILSGQTGSFTLSIADFVNEDLADPAQGLCEIEIEFIHGFVSYLELSLTSPGGQTIDLIGPGTVQNGSSLFSKWDISFIPSVEPAMPDSGFLDRWDNTQASLSRLGFPYTGSYYPANGNLEDFTTGPVNGDWTFTFDNVLSFFNDGAIFYVRLIFCDSRGVDCCFGVGGELQTPDILACEGGASLLIDPDPLFQAGAADTAEFDYTYLLARDSLIIDYDTVPDLQSFPAGQYQICGLSYRATQVDSLALTIGNMTIDSLSANLNSFFPLFCGNLSDNCINIQIEAPPDTVFLIEQICQGDSVMVGDSVIYNTGNYTIDLESFAGCDSIVDLNLTVVNTIIEDLNITICEGDSFLVGTNAYLVQGTYVDTLQTAIGCDSIVNLDLEVLQPIVTDLTELICPGESYPVGDTLFTDTGNYQVRLTSARNCDSIVNLNLRVLDLMIDLPVPDTIDCRNNGITLDASNSSPAGNLAFSWQDLDENILGGSALLTVNAADTVVLSISRSEAGKTCVESDTMIVFEDRVFPIADAGPSLDLSCSLPIQNIGGPTSSTGPIYTYLWETSDGQLVGANTNATAMVNTAGTYTLTVTNEENGCETPADVVVGTDTALPIADAGPDTLLTCEVVRIELNGTTTSSGPEFLYYWIDENNDTIPGANNPSFEVDTPGQYTLRVTNSDNGCTITSTATVDQDTLLPALAIAAPILLNCETTEQTLDATASDQGANFELTWRVTDGGNIVNGQGTASPLINATGNYELVITNQQTACRDSATVVVRDTIVTILADIEPTTNLTCDAPTATLSIGNNASIGRDVEYRWRSVGGGFTADSVGTDVIVNLATTYSLIVLDTFTRCADTVSVVVDQDVDLPVAEAGTGFTINCAVSEGTLSGIGSSIGANFTYNWQGPCILTAIDQTEIQVDCPGTYYLEVTNTDNLCTTLDSVIVVEELEEPIAAIAAPPILTCENTTVDLTGANSTSSGGLDFAWHGPGLMSGQTDRLATVNQAGTYQLIVRDQVSLCTDTTTVLVTEEVELPMVDLGQDTSLNCATTSLTLGGDGNAAGPDFDYQWRTLQGSVPANNTEPTLTVTEPGIYRLIIENTVTGCSDSSTVVISLIDDPPFVDAGEDVEFFCDTDSLILLGRTNLDLADALIQWTGPCLEGAQDSLRAVITCPGDYILQVTDQLTACVNTDTMTVTVSPIVPVAILADTAMINCETGQAVLDASASSFGTYSWAFEGNPLSGTNNVIGVEEAGVYTFTVSNLDGSCTDQRTIEVIENCGPQIVIATPDSLNCLVSSVTLDARASSQGSNLTFEWIPPAASCVLGGESTPLLTVNCPGDYSLVVTNTEVMSSDTQTVTVVLDTIRPLVEAGMPDTITCTMPQVELNGVGSSSNGPFKYQWANFNTAEVVDSSLSTTISMAGTYILEVTDTSNFCTNTDIVQIRIDENIPQISFGNQLFPCLATTFDLESIVTPTTGNYQYQWTGPGIVSGANTGTVRIDTIGTYQLEILDLDNGCIDIDVVEVEEQDCVPCISLQGPDTLALNCIVDTLTIEAQFCDDCVDCIVQWSTLGGNFVGVTDSLGIAVDQAGTYILSVTDTIGFTSTLEVVVLDQTTPPIADAGLDRSLSCDSLSVTLGSLTSTQGPNIAYEWTDEAGIVRGDSLFFIADQAGTYSLLLIDNTTGCTALDEVIVDQTSTPPIADAGNDVELTCQSNVIVLDGTNSATGNRISYEWTSDQNVGCLQGAETTSPIVTCPGSYFLLVRDSQTGCISRDTVVVTQSTEIPNLIPFPDTLLTCGDTSITLVGTLPLAGTFIFEWCEIDNNDQLILGTCESTLEYPVQQSGRYRFSVEDSNSGCQNSFIVSVGVDTLAPAVEAGMMETLVCTIPSMELQGSADLINRTYQWTALNGTMIENATSLSPTIFSPDTFVLAVTNTLNQCVATDSVIILRDENAPVADAGTDANISCAAASLQLNGIATSNSGQVDFLWSTTNGNFISATNQLNPSVNQAGVYYLTVNDLSNQCTSRDSVVINLDQDAPIADIVGLADLAFSCDSTRLRLDATASVASDNHELAYEWTSLSAGQLIGNAMNSVIDVEGVGRYQLLVSDLDNACSDTLIFSIGGSFDLPVINLAPVNQLDCANETVLLDASASTGPGLVINWGDDTSSDLALDTALFEVNTPGTYQVQVLDTSNGCEQSQLVTIDADTTVPKVNILPPAALDCMNTSVNLSGNGSDFGANFTYEWTSPSGSFVGASNLLETEISAAGTYFLTVRNTQNACESTDSIIVEALSHPILGTAVAIRPPACAGENTGRGRILVDSINGGTGPFLFALNGNAFTDRRQFEDLVPGRYQLDIEDANGCTWSEEVVVPEEAEIAIDLGPDLEIKFGEEVLLEAITNAENIAEVIWLPADGDTLDNPLQQLLVPTHSNKYSVTIVDDQGCRASDEIIVIVLERKRYFAPTVFYPNGNGINDTYTLYAGNDVQEIRSFQIFDRWGNLVFGRERFQPNDPTLGWDGNFNGQPMNAAVYVFYAEIEYIDGRVEIVQGDLALIR